ncbi:MAG: flotillin family protein [Rhizobiaceae bacterium]
MFWLVWVIVTVIVIVLAILFLNRYYRKATREVALIRTGAGGQQVVLDGGCLTLPFLHKVSEINMRTSKLEIERSGANSIITSDRLRVDIAAEFYVRVDGNAESVAKAAQTLASKTFRAPELAEVLDGKLVDAMLSVAAGYTMDGLQDNRGKYSAEVEKALADNLAQNGLALESVSIMRLDQTPFSALDENNAFNALGMRRLSEIISVNKKERAVIEADAEVAVRQAQVDATKRKLVIGQEEEEATINQQRDIESMRAKSMADVAEEQSTAEKRREAARIEREREVRMNEISRDRALRKEELESELNIGSARADNAVALAAKGIEEAKAESGLKAAIAKQAAAEEEIQTARDMTVADREKQLALIRAQEQAEVDDTRVKSEAGTVVSMANAEAEALLKRAEAQKDELLARAEGTAALVKAENAQSNELMALKLDEKRLIALPGVVEKLMKPTEKIDSIHVNHISGLTPGFNGQSGSRQSDNGGSGSGDSGGGAINDVVDGVLGLALQLPAVKKLGEEVGMNISDGMKGVTAALESSGPAEKNRKSKPRKKE